MPLSGFGAADALAAGTRGGIGGWWAVSDSLGIVDIFWFRVDLEKVKWPRVFHLEHDRAKDIAFYEALGQVLLAWFRVRATKVSECQVFFRQACDNTPTVGAFGKWLSTKAPLCYAVQALAWVCASNGCVPSISHVAGCRNEWADSISRWSEPHGQQLVARLDAAKEVQVDMSRFLAKVWPRASLRRK